MGKYRHLLTEKQMAFIDFLVDPQADKPSQAAWCAANGVAVRSATNWKKEKSFRDEWEERAYEIYGGPDLVGRIVQAVYERAVAGDTRAAQLYLQYVDKFTPKREVVSTSNKGLTEMSDAELEEALKNVHSLRARREKTA